MITISCEGAVGALRRGSLAGGVGGGQGNLFKRGGMELL